MGNNKKDLQDDGGNFTRERVIENFLPEGSDHGVHLLSIFYTEGRLGFVSSETLMSAPLKGRKEVSDRILEFIKEKILSPDTNLN
jgi:hypothetical protein